LDYQCHHCARSFPIVNGVPDFYIAESDHDFNHDPNIIWLDAQIVEARNTVYRLCARELIGMAFCMQALSRRTGNGCRILEVGMGTGHFTRWLSEVSKPGTAIYAFDFSWPIIKKARTNINELTGITLFRANAREGLPFQPEAFDIVLIRLAPLGASGVPNLQATFELLKPGGYYFGAGWERGQFEVSPTEWAFQHGYHNTEYHEWRYHRLQSREEHDAWQIEIKQLLAMHEWSKPEAASKSNMFDFSSDQDSDGNYTMMTVEHLLMAQKPA
jgi:SAM-dependent methyltransferase